MMQPMPVILASLFLAACQLPTADPQADACGASAYAGLIGQPLAAVTLPADLDARIIAPDTLVTLDHKPDRLNIRVDDGGTITAVDCG